MNVNPDQLKQITTVLSAIQRESPITSSNAADQVYEILILIDLATRLGNIKIINDKGEKCCTYYYRSAPGYLTNNKSSCGAAPGAISVECDGIAVELHNGVRWKNCMGGNDSEMDVAVVKKADIAPHRGCGKAVSPPIYGSVECKHHSDKISIGDARGSLMASLLVKSRFHSLVSCKKELNSAKDLFLSFGASHFGDVEDPSTNSYTTALDLIASAVKTRVKGQKGDLHGHIPKDAAMLLFYTSSIDS